MPEIFVLIIPLFLIGFGLLAYYSYQQAKKRREELAALAARWGWSFSPSYESDWDSRYSQFGCFTQGHSRCAYNLLQGTIEVDGQHQPCTVGDYTYKVTTGSGKDENTTTYYFSFLLFELPFVGLPQLAIRPEGFFDSVTSFMGFDDIDFESEEFSRKFHVKSSDKRFVYDLLHPRTMEFMLDTPPATFEIERDVFCLKSSSSCWQVPEIEQQVEWCKRWLSLWPPHLVADLKSRAAR
jgi:hypothetical protein